MLVQFSIRVLTENIFHIFNLAQVLHVSIRCMAPVCKKFTLREKCPNAEFFTRCNRQDLPVVVKSLFNRVLGLEASNLIKKRLQHNETIWTRKNIVFRHFSCSVISAGNKCNYTKFKKIVKIMTARAVK